MEESEKPLINVWEFFYLAISSPEFAKLSHSDQSRISHKFGLLLSGR